MLDKQELSDASKFLSYVLRHRPDEIGISLDAEGWADIDQLITGAARVGRALDLQTIQRIVANPEKRRFALSDNGRRIRALQGHSIAAVSLGYAETPPLAVLYHGTASHFLPGIGAEGLVPGQRQFVHLSEDAKTASRVGRRHGTPVVLIVDAQTMHAKGYAFYRADNGVWLTKQVPAEFISPI